MGTFLGTYTLPSVDWMKGIDIHRSHNLGPALQRRSSTMKRTLNTILDFFILPTMHSIQDTFATFL